MAGTETKRTASDASSSTSPSAAPASSGWGVVYKGPKSPTKVAGCGTCLSAAAGLCSHQPPHASFTEGCGLCVAARDQVCGAHGRGAARALDAYGKSLTGRDAKVFAAARAVVDAELAEMSDSCNVEIEMGGSVGAHVDGAGSATGAPSRSIVILVKQLP